VDEGEMGWKEWELELGSKEGGEQVEGHRSRVGVGVEPTSQVCFGRAPDNQRASREA
jgi:hypothetical protein